jgi:hypothetical protein
MESGPQHQRCRDFILIDLKLTPLLQGGEYDTALQAAGSSLNLDEMPPGSDESEEIIELLRAWSNGLCSIGMLFHLL